MFIKKITIQNFRLFASERTFEIDNINIPDDCAEGSGLTVFVGENACGKTALLDAFALPLLLYKADGFALSDFFDPDKATSIQIFSQSDFEFNSIMPKVTYKGKGFVFEARVRTRDTKKYLSSIVVSDQRYIRADNEEKPEDGKPDLRVSVNNPWSGPRFNENDILFLDKNRTYQTRSGSYSQTRFDRLMEDFDFQYIKQENAPFDCNEKLKDISNNIENAFLRNVIDKFKEISGEKISLAHINNWTPHKKAFFCINKENKQHIPLDGIGSGYEMVFSLLYSFFLATQSKKQLIVFIDEPELHLHPKLQEDFVKILFEFSKTAQIIITTHSPLFIKQVLNDEKLRVRVLQKANNEVIIAEVDERVLPYMSANEINYIAFNMPTEEYYNELYEELKSLHGEKKTIKEFDKDYFVDKKNAIADSPWKKNASEVSSYTFIRNQIHHPKDNEKVRVDILKPLIRKMREYLKEDLPSQKKQ